MSPTYVNEQKYFDFNNAMVQASQDGHDKIVQLCQDWRY